MRGRGSGTETPRQTPCKRPGEREDRAREEWTEEVPEARRGGKVPPAVGLPQAGADPDPNPRAQPGGVSPGLLPWPKGESWGRWARAPLQPQALRPRTEASVPRQLPADHEASVGGRPACTQGPAPSALAQKAASGCGPLGVSLLTPHDGRVSKSSQGATPNLWPSLAGTPELQGKVRSPPTGLRSGGGPASLHRTHFLSPDPSAAPTEGRAPAPLPPQRPWRRKPSPCLWEGLRPWPWRLACPPSSRPPGLLELQSLLVWLEGKEHSSPTGLLPGAGRLCLF